MIRFLATWWVNTRPPTHANAFRTVWMLFARHGVSLGVLRDAVTPDHASLDNEMTEPEVRLYVVDGELRVHLPASVPVKGKKHYSYADGTHGDINVWTLTPGMHIRKPPHTVCMVEVATYTPTWYIVWRHQ